MTPPLFASPAVLDDVEFDLASRLIRADAGMKLSRHERVLKRGGFAAILCRCVVIYFDRAAQADPVDRCATLLPPGGALAVGHTGCLPAGHRRLKACGRTAYELVL